MSFNSIIAELKKGTTKPIYVLHGEEDYFIDAISNYISKHILNESERGFDQVTMYGLDSDVNTLIARLKQYPVLAPKQIVILKEAQKLKDFKALEQYFSQPAPTTVFVVCFKNKTTLFRKGSKLSKAIEGNGVLFESKKLYDNQIPEWINSQLSAKGISIEPKASALLSEFVGSDLSRLNNEINKLMIHASQNGNIDTQMIESNVGISRDYNIFELQKALGNRDTSKIFRIVSHFNKNPRDNSIMKTIPSLYGFFVKLYKLQSTRDHSRQNIASLLKINPYFANDYLLALKNYSPHQVENIFGILHNYDLRAKGVENINVKDTELLKEMIYKIISV